MLHRPRRTYAPMQTIRPVTRRLPVREIELLPTRSEVMTYAAPTRIELISPAELSLSWPDGSTARLTLKTMRDECPCAGCKGEVILGKVYKPSLLPTFTPGMYELRAIEPVGNYGIQVTWKDGHHTGIYSWEYLHLLAFGAKSDANEA